jgi:hypothetical protein
MGNVSETVMQIIASVSCCASLFIIFMFYKYPELNKIELSRLVNMICICDLFGSIGMALGHPEDGSTRCIIQAILTNIFPIAGVFWTTLISFLLLIHVFKMRPIDRFSWPIYLLCFLVPILVTFLPLTTNQFGLDEDENHNAGWCFLKDRSDSPSWSLIFWTAVSFYLWMWGGMLLYLILFFFVARETHRVFAVNPNLPNWKTFSKILLYFFFPFNLFLCWLPATIYDFLRTSGAGSYAGHRLLGAVSDITPTFLGLANAIAFISINEHMRSKVMQLLSSRRGDEEDDDDAPIRVVFQEEEVERQQRESELVKMEMGRESEETGK